MTISPDPPPPSPTAPLIGLVGGLPSLTPTLASDRWLANLIVGAAIALLLGLVAIIVGTQLPASFIWIGWVGVAIYIAGGVTFVVHTFLNGGAVVLRLRKAEPLLLEHLDGVWNQEWTTVQQMVAGRWDVLASRARWVKMQAQLLDRSTGRTTILGLLFTSAASLIAPTITGEKLATLRDLVQAAPIALAAGLAIPTLVHHILAGRLLRVEWMLTEVAIGAKALADTAKVSQEPAPQRARAKRKGGSAAVQ